MKFFKLPNLLAFAALFFIALSALHCNAEVAGGVSEETNTIAGTLTLPGGEAASRVRVEARAFSNEESLFSDTTNDRGEFSIAAGANGTYGISVLTDSFALYDTVSVFGKRVHFDGKLSSAKSISGNVFLRTGKAAIGATVKLSGSPWNTYTDSNGHFSLSSIPYSNHPLTILSPEPNHYLHTAVPLQAAFNVILPLSPDYGCSGYWNFDVNANGYIDNMRGLSGKAKLYGNAALASGRGGNKALHLSSAEDFAVMEMDGGILDNATDFTVEAWVNIANLGDKQTFVKNIFGKLGFSDSAVFSLAVVRDTCNARKAAFAFFLAEGSGDSLHCKNAVIASDTILLNKWYHLAATWDGDSTALYIDGSLAGKAKSPVQRLIGENGIPFYFGKENLDLLLDDIRLSTVAIEETDALYRYRNGGGE